MRAVTWHGKRDVRVEDVPDPKLIDPTDIIIRVTSTGICGSDLHLYEVLGAFLDAGDILGHEPMGIVEEVGPGVTELAVGDRVVVPFNISCGTCFMCGEGLHSQCETTQVREQGTGASLFGYTKLYGQVPGGQAEFLRVPFGNTLPVKVPEGPPDDRFVYLSDVLPTAWQAVEYADVRAGRNRRGAGARADRGHGGAGRPPARRRQGDRRRPGARAPRAGAGAGRRDPGSARSRRRDLGDTIREMTDGRGPEAVIDAVGMEAHGAPVAKFAQAATALLPDAVAAKLMEKAGVDRLTAFYAAIDIVRRGGTISLVGVYGGEADPLPMLTMFDKQIQLRMGQANVRRWVDDILPLLTDEDPLGTEDFATHRLPLGDAPDAYSAFQKKEDGAIKILLQP